MALLVWNYSAISSFVLGLVSSLSFPSSHSSGALVARQAKLILGLNNAHNYPDNIFG
jgi:hypothetical protein